MYYKRKANVIMAYLELSPKLRKIFGKPRFSASTKTNDMKTAKRRGAVLEAQWKAQIAAATQTSSWEQEAEFWRTVMNNAKPEQRSLIQELIDEQASLLVYQGAVASNVVDAEDPFADQLPESVAADTMVKIATGNLTKLSEHVEKYRQHIAALEPKTVDATFSNIGLLTSKYSYLEDIDGQEFVDIFIQQGLANTTIKNKYGYVRGFLNYIKKGAGDALFKDITLPKESKKGKVKKKANVAWTINEVVALYHEARKPDRYGRIDYELIDLIDMGRYTGGRIEELCSLKIEDVHDDCSWYEVIDAKTDSGFRKVPIHSKLRPIMQRLCVSSTDGYVISGLTFNKYNDRSNAIGKRFGRLKESLGFKGRTKSFHSFRSTVCTFFKNAGIPEATAADIVGHEVDSMTFGLYAGEVDMQIKKGAIEVIDYPV